MKYRRLFTPGIVLAALPAVILAVWLGFSCALLLQSHRAVLGAKYIAEDVSGIIMRFTVYGTSDSTISARFWFYDRDGKEAGIIERSWNGWELFLEFIVAEFGDVHIVFPYKIYTNEISHRYGTDCLPRYDREDMPGIYDSSALDEQQRDAFRVLFRHVKTVLEFNLSPPQIKMNTIHLRNPQVGRIYAVYVDASGTVTVILE
ncbi:MAG: hypothetical protein LBR47_06000 [Spirochaetaceae bacterium]|jgi:hypothetical protein|nr:hypothetical protein [Spirochaetaceae bacterium]